MHWKNLVFEGGGIKGIAYAGALEVLEKNGCLNKFEKVAGTSVGGIMALLVCLGWSSQKIKEKLVNTDFSKFKDSDPLIWQDAIRFFDSFGLYKGETIINWIRGILSESSLPEDVTFGTLARKRLPELYIMATNVTRGRPDLFCCHTTPDLSIVDALRASFSIPYIFSAHEINGDIYVDGGLLVNYPIHLFDQNFGKTAICQNVDTLGIKLTSNFDPPYPKQEFSSVFDFGKKLLYLVLDHEDAKWTVGYRPFEIIIDCGKIQSTNFDIKEEKKQWLLEKGMQAAGDFFSKNLVALDKGHSPIQEKLLDTKASRIKRLYKKDIEIIDFQEGKLITTKSRGQLLDLYFLTEKLGITEIGLLPDFTKGPSLYFNHLPHSQIKIAKRWIQKKPGPRQPLNSENLKAFGLL